MFIEILGYMALSMLILAFSWFMGWRILKHFGYEIKKIEEKVVYYNLKEH